MRLKSFVAMVSAWLILNLIVVAQDQPNRLVGPLVVSDWFGALTFHDLGSNAVWDFDLNVRAGESSWSPDGCTLLIHEIGSLEWFILNPINGNIRVVANSADFVYPQWSLDGETIIFTEFQLQGTSHIYQYHIEDDNFSVLFEIDGPGVALRWLSTTELLFRQSDGWLYVLNIETNNVSRFGTELYPPYSQPDIEGYNYRLSHLSPNHILLAVHQMPAAFIYPELQLYYESEAELLEAYNEVEFAPGFSIYDLNAGISTDYELYDEYVLTISWSPQSSHLAILSSRRRYELDHFHLYAFDLSTEAFTYLGNYDIAYYPEFGGYTPTWAWDETMINVQTLDGPIVFNLEDGSSMILDDRMQGELIWSPVMAYEEGQCVRE